MIFHILEDFLSIDMYINRKKTIQKRVDSIVSPFKKATRDAGQESTEKIVSSHFVRFHGEVVTANKTNQKFSEKKNK